MTARDPDRDLPLRAAAEWVNQRRSASIRSTLVVGTLLIVLVVLGAIAWFSVQSAREEANELFDARLASSARVLESMLAHQLEIATLEAPIEIKLPIPLRNAGGHRDEATPLGHYYEAHLAFQVWRDEQPAPRLLAHSGRDTAEPFVPLVPGYGETVMDNFTWQVFTLRSGPVWVQVAERDDARIELNEKLGLDILYPVVGGLLMLLLALSLLIRFGLSPLSDLARRISARQPEALEAVQLSRTPEEMQPVVTALNALFARCREALERERRFTDAAAHELRTPLAALKVHLQNMDRAQTEEDRQRSMSRATQAMARAVQLTEQMLAYSRVARTMQEPPSQEVDLSHIAQEAVDHARSTVEQTLHLQLLVQPEQLCVTGDPHQLAGLVDNLIVNAARYSPPGGEIRVRLTRERNDCVLEVEDQGPGIPPELRERVFESYYRIPGSLGSGSGLGLAIVREIAQRHHGQVGIADATDGQGARIWLRIPARG